MPVIHTCPECERFMDRDTGSGSVVFRCFCGVATAGGPDDVRLASDILGAGQVKQKYARSIRNAALDRTTQQVAEECPDCYRPYLAQVRVGNEEVVVWKCQCGYQMTPSDAAAPAAPEAGVPPGAEAAAARAGLSAPRPA